MESGHNKFLFMRLRKYSSQNSKPEHESRGWEYDEEKTNACHMLHRDTSRVAWGEKGESRPITRTRINKAFRAWQMSVAK